MTKNSSSNEYNENWEREIAEFDARQKKRETEFNEHMTIIPPAGNEELSDEENAVLTRFLGGMSCEEIAKEAEVDTETIVGVIQIIQAKLSVSD